jgi:hypothetical protein
MGVIVILSPITRGARARGIIEKRLGFWAGLAAAGVVIGFIVVVRVL